MTGQSIHLAGVRLLATAAGALWWEDERLLCVADLHLGKAERMARRSGALLPPYETSETLERLASEIARLSPARVICLGDSSDDCAAREAISRADGARLAAMVEGREWIWIAGNHDPVPLGLGGVHREELVIGPLTFRHAATAEPCVGEVSGHYHPKMRLVVRGSDVSRPCFVFDSVRVILPAFGAYTGGLRTSDTALAALLAPDAQAVLTGDPCVTVPLSAAWT